MENKKRLIILFMVVSGFFMCLNGVSAADISIDGNTWTINEINSYFNGVTVHGLTISDGDTIIFQAGDYLNLALSVKNAVNIIANNTVHFIGKGAAIGISVSNANNVNITGIVVSNYTYGIYVAKSNNTGIINNTAYSNTKNGITLDTSSNTAIINNTVYNNTNRGIYLSSSVNSNVSNNIINNSLGNGGIISATSINSYIFNNTITHNVDGIYVYANSVNTTILSNNVNNNVNNGIVIGSTTTASFNTTIVNNTANKNGYDGIRLINTVNSTITNNTASNNKNNGILLLNADNSTLTSNTLSNNTQNGISVTGTGSSTLNNNTATNNKGSGIAVSSSGKSTITNNTATNNTQNGISVTGTGSSTLNNNTATNNKGSGIAVSSSGKSTITNNTAANNTQNGITVTGTGSSTLNNNTATNNKGSGIAVSSSGKSTITNNTAANNTQNGITVTGTGSSILNDNIVFNNVLSGVRLENSGNSMSNNSLINNGVGVSIYAANNIVADNEIRNNGVGVFVGYSNANIVLGQNNLSDNLYGLSISGNNNKLSNFTVEKNVNGVIVNGINNVLNNVNISNNLNAGLIFNSTSSGNIFSNGSITNNLNGIIMNGKNDSVLSSSILHNTAYGFTVNGSGNILNYNRIFQNNLGLNNTGNKTNANLNWWGINNAKTQVTDSGTDLDMTYWYVLQLSSNNFNTTVNATQSFNPGDSVTLGYSLETNIPVSNNKELLPFFEVSVTKPDGSTLTGDIRNTSVSYDIIAKNGAIYTIKSISDDENIKISINTPTSYLDINKTVNNSKPRLNDIIKYTITVTNNGPDNATNVYVTDILPKGLKFISADTNYNPITGIWTIGNLLNGQTVVLNIFAQVVQSNTNITNTAIVNQTNYNPNPNNQSNSTITVEKESILIIKKLVNNSKPKLNDIIKYTITVTNNGPDNATNVYVKDILPKGLKFISADSNYNPTTGIWTIGNLLNGQTVVLNIFTQVVQSNTNITNTATVNQTNYNPNPNNQSNSTITVEKASNLTIINTVNNSKPKLNDIIKYTITVRNNGPDNATNVYVTDILPKGLKFISADSNYNPTTGIWTIGNLLNGQTVVLNIIAQVVQSNTNITNTATVNQTNYNPNPNNQSNNTITVENTSDPVDPTHESIVGGNTVPMQDTGVPLVGLVLAILAVIGGFIVPRNK